MTEQSSCPGTGSMEEQMRVTTLEGDEFRGVVLRLKAMMELSGHSVKSLAEAAGLSRGCIVSIMGDKTNNMFLSTFVKLARAFGVSPNWVLSWGVTKFDKQRESFYGRRGARCSA